MRAPLLVALPLALAACTTASSPPRVALTVPPTFARQTGRKTYRQGAPLTNDPTFAGHYLAERPTTRLYGRAGGRNWVVEVQNGASPQVQRALRARDGYEADLGFAVDASARIYPRFRHKRFAWGDAVSFLVQYQNDNTSDVPNNGMLLYEVHGITRDGRYTVRAQFAVTHPGLTDNGPAVRDHRGDAADPDSPMRRDRDYLLGERCPDGAFQPGIDAVDALLETLRPGSS